MVEENYFSSVGSTEGSFRSTAVLDPSKIDQAGIQAAHDKAFHQSSYLGAYVHVPFCARRCGYCDFNTYTARDFGEGASRGEYSSKVCEELKLLYSWYERTGQTIQPLSTIFFGGGTPTLLPAADLIKIVETLDKLWGLEENCEITTEANPDSVDEKYIKDLRDGGFNRISFGMQSAVPHVLQTLDRTHRQENVIRGVRAAHDYGLRCSVDLIYGTPGESLVDWEKSLESALLLEVNHISCYALTLEARTKMGRAVRRGMLRAPSDDDQAVKYEMAEKILTTQGFSWYEISNWAKNGEVCRHNINYWNNEDWLAVGPGAHGHCRSLRYWDEAHPLKWVRAINAGHLPWKGCENLTPQEQREEDILLALRMESGFDIEKFEEEYGLKIDRKIIEKLIEDGLLEKYYPPIYSSTIKSASLDSVSSPDTLHSFATSPSHSHYRLRPTLKGRLLNDFIIMHICRTCT